jgi:hypothetical protein
MSISNVKCLDKFKHNYSKILEKDNRYGIIFTSLKMFPIAIIQ